MSETQEILHWLAFRYIANELDATEANEFESLLSTDQAAREAVARVVEETCQIRQALTGSVVTANSQRSNWNHKTTRVAVVTTGSCLTLLLAIGLILSSRPISDTVARRATETDSSVSRAQLAYAWAEARGGLTELQPALADPLDSVLIAAIDSEFEQSLVAPSWMLAALAKMDGGIDLDIEIQE